MVMSIDQLIRELALAMERGGENKKEKGEGRRRAEGRGRQSLTDGRRQAQTQLHPQPFGSYSSPASLPVTPGQVDPQDCVPSNRGGSHARPKCLFAASSNTYN